MRALALLAALWSASASAQMTFSYLPFKMTSSAAQPFGWYLDARSSSPAGLTLTSVQGAAEAAWTSWNNVSCARPKASFLGLTTGTVPNPTDAYDVYSTMGVWALSASDGHYQQYLYGVDDILAMAMPSSYAGELLTCDVYLNAVKFQWSVVQPTAADVVDLQSVLTHEFGHCLGLDHHFFNPDDVMQASITRGQTRRALTVADTGSLCNRYPKEGAVGAPCLGDGGCTGSGTRCVTQTVNAQVKTFCSVGCNLGSGFVCEIPLSCKAASAFNPGFTGACLMNDGSETRVGIACTADAQCGSAVGYCMQPFQGSSGTTFWQSGYCTQSCIPGRPPCPAGSLCTTIAVNNDYCLQQCRVGLGECRQGYSCALTSQGGVCVPECKSDTDCGDTSTWMCRQCDGLCVAKQNAAGQVGDVCTADTACGAGQICAQMLASNTLKVCTQGCARGCGTCPTGSSCHPIGLKSELYCLRNCNTGTCPQGEQCAQLPTGRGCMPGCKEDSDCAVGTECRFGECTLLGPDDAGCPFCPQPDDGGGNAPRRDGGTGGGGGGTCGCSGGLPGPQSFIAALLVVCFGRLRRRP